MIPAVIGGRRLPLISALVVASLAQAGGAAVAVFCVQRIFDDVLMGNAGVGAAAFPALGFTMAALAAAALDVFRTRTGERLGLGYVADVRETLFGQIMRASAASLSKRRQGGLLLPFVGDLTAIKKWVSDGLVRLISASATALMLLTVLASQNRLLALSAGAVVALAALAALLLSAPLSRAIAQTRSRRGAVANFVSSSIRAAQTVQAFDQYEREAARLRRRSDALMRSGLDLASISGGMTAIVHLATMLLVAVTLLVGVIEVRAGAMSVGLVAAAISVAGLLAGAVRDLGVAFELWRRAKLSFAKIGAALAIPTSIATDSRPVRGLGGKPGRLTLAGVEVQGVLSVARARARAGDVISVIGESGAGKSTLLALVARLRDPDAGRIRIDGRDVQRIALPALRRRVGVASAATPLMRGSLGMNLRYAGRNTSPAERERVSEICNLAPIFARFEAGEEARISDGAPELSLGEIQRLQIARAMLGSPPILILDDVDSHLDAETAARVAQHLRNYPGIVLMASQSAMMRRAATAVWRLQGGRLNVESAATPVEIVHLGENSVRT